MILTILNNLGGKMLIKRSIASIIVFSIITCGIYPMFLIVNLNNEFAIQNNENVNGWMVIFLSIITCGIYGVIWFYKMGSVIEKSGGKNEETIYLVLSLFGLGLVALCLMQIQENNICDSLKK